MNQIDNTLRENLCVTDLPFLGETLAILEPPTPEVVHQDEPLIDVIKLMKERRLGCMLVVDDQEKLSGIFTERDLLLKVSLTAIDLENTAVRSVMTENPACDFMHTSIAVALYKMSKGGFRHLPIVDDSNRSIGIISAKDIMDFLAIQLMKNLFTTK